MTDSRIINQSPAPPASLDSRPCKAVDLLQRNTDPLFTERTKETFSRLAIGLISRHGNPSWWTAMDPDNLGSAVFMLQCDRSPLPRAAILTLHATSSVDDRCYLLPSMPPLAGTALSWKGISASTHWRSPCADHRMMGMSGRANNRTQGMPKNQISNSTRYVVIFCHFLPSTLV